MDGGRRGGGLSPYLPLQHWAQYSTVFIQPPLLRRHTVLTGNNILLNPYPGTYCTYTVRYVVLGIWFMVHCSWFSSILLTRPTVPRCTSITYSSSLLLVFDTIAMEHACVFVYVPSAPPDWNFWKAYSVHYLHYLTTSGEGVQYNS